MYISWWGVSRTISNYNNWFLTLDSVSSAAGCIAQCQGGAGHVHGSALELRWLGIPQFSHSLGTWEVLWGPPEGLLSVTMELELSLDNARQDSVPSGVLPRSYRSHQVKVNASRRPGVPTPQDYCVGLPATLWGGY